MYMLVFYVPPSHLDDVKEAVFAAGGGRIGNYDRCCWQTLGRGQFRPLPGSAPFVGRQGDVETCDEVRVELVCLEDCLENVLNALRASHPYETPAYACWSVSC